MAKRGEFNVSTLFLTFPELRFDIQVLQEMLLSRFLSDDDRDLVEETLTQARRADRTVKRMRGKSVLQRLLVLAPEMMNVSTVEALRTFGMIDVREAQAGRILARALAAVLTGGVPTSPMEVLARAGTLAGTFLGRDTINLLKALDDEEIVRLRDGFLRVARQQGRKGLNATEQAIIREFRESAEDLARKGRAALTGYRALKSGIHAAKNADSVYQAVQMVVPNLLTMPMVRAAQALGFLNARQVAVMEQILAYGPVAWRAGLAAVKADGYQQRLLMGMYGALSQELLDALAGLGVISPAQRRLLQPAVSAARDVLRTAVDATTAPRKYRVVPGEPPIKTYARMQRGSDRAVLSLLAEAAKDASREADRLAALGRRGALTRSRQYQVAARELHETMRYMWEDMGHLIIRGEREVALAAIEAMQELEKTLYKGNGKRIANVDGALRAQGRAGVDSFISRQENVVQLSARVYKNRVFWEQSLDRRISIALLKGESAAELARSIRGFIDPNVRGGVSYAATRLARTEINNAFHLTSIRYTREQPWVTGYKWHLSGSHGTPDICNDYATKDHVGKGPGIWGKRGVPGKPHPNCLCYITPVLVDEDQFLRAAQAGRYKQYWSTAAS